MLPHSIAARGDPETLRHRALGALLWLSCQLSHCRPDLNTDDLVAKRANAEKVKLFSKNLRVINKQADRTCRLRTDHVARPSPRVCLYLWLLSHVVLTQSRMVHQ